MSEYSVYVIPSVLQALKKLPGNVRQRVKRAIEGLTNDPRSPESKRLQTDDPIADPVEIWRVRIDSWRIVYMIAEAEKTVDVVAVRKRPPYDYGDLAELLSRGS